jgi:phosphonatase-like hydrolase
LELGVAVPELVIFDLAGTTVEDRGQVPDAFAAALADYGVTVTPDQIRRVRGASKRQAVLQFIPPGEDRAAIAAAAYTAFLKHLTRRYAGEGVREIGGAGAVFRRLRASGIRVGLNTGFDREITTYLLAALGWEAGVVDGVVCGDDVAHGRPAPDLILALMRAVGLRDVQRVASVGDTILDLEAGARAGVGWNIGVLSGAHDRLALESAPHTHLLDSVADVPGIWELKG